MKSANQIRKFSTTAEAADTLDSENTVKPAPVANWPLGTNSSLFPVAPSQIQAAAKAHIPRRPARALKPAQKRMVPVEALPRRDFGERPGRLSSER